MNHDFLTNIEQALHIASDILNENFGKITASEQKQDQSNIVTQADLDAEHAIIQFLKTKYPNHNFLAEETGFQNQRSEYTWVIDPLDGTSNFASKIPWFGVIIALLKNGIPHAAGVTLPQQQETFLAETGKGTFKNGKKVSVSAETDLRKVLFSYCLDFSTKDGQTDYESRIISQLVRRIRNLRSTNSVTDFCYVADGRLGGCINQTTKIWDIAGPWLLVKEAGGTVTDHLGKEIVFDLNAETYDKNYTIMVTNSHFFETLKGITHQCL